MLTVSRHLVMRDTHTTHRVDILLLALGCAATRGGIVMSTDAATDDAAIDVASFDGNSAGQPPAVQNG
jgi:hypothetical protein